MEFELDSREKGFAYYDLCSIYNYNYGWQTQQEFQFYTTLLDFKSIFVENFLIRNFPQQNMFIHFYEVLILDKILNKEIGNDYKTNKSYYKELNKLDISNLFFWQPSVGYDKVIGKISSNSEGNPILVIKLIDDSGERHIIINGYHRTFNHLYNGKQKIDCLIKTVIKLSRKVICL
jgi:hypothetical protein